MRILIVLLLIAGGVVGFGFYRGWFHLESDRAADKPSVTVTVDKEKMQEDKHKAQDKVSRHD